MAVLDLSTITIPGSLTQVAQATGIDIMDVGYLCSDTRPFFKFTNGSLAVYTKWAPANVPSAKTVDVYAKKTQTVDGQSVPLMSKTTSTGSQNKKSLTYGGKTYTYSTYENIRMYAINKYAKYKPVICSSVSSSNSGAGDSGTYGLEMYAPTTGNFATVVEETGFRYSLIPSPTDNNWKRLKDFNGYDHTASHFAQGVYNQDAVTIDSSGFAIVFNNAPSNDGIPLDAFALAIAKGQGGSSSFEGVDRCYVICCLNIKNCSDSSANGVWLMACSGGVNMAVGSTIGKVGTGNTTTFQAGSIPSIFSSINSSVTADCWVSFFLADRYTVAGAELDGQPSGNVELTTWKRINPGNNTTSLSGLFTFVIPIENAVRKYIQLKGKISKSYYSFSMSDSSVVSLKTTNCTLKLGGTGTDSNGSGGHNTYTVTITFQGLTGDQKIYTTTNVTPTASQSTFTYGSQFTLTYGKKYYLYIEITADNKTIYSNTLANSGSGFTVTY